MLCRAASKWFRCGPNTSRLSNKIYNVVGKRDSCVLYLWTFSTEVEGIGMNRELKIWIFYFYSSYYVFKLAPIRPWGTRDDPKYIELIITSLDFHVGWHRVRLTAARAVRLCRRGRHRLLVVLHVRAPVVRQQRRRGARGRRRDRFALFNQFDYLVGFLGQVAVWSERIIPSVRTETTTWNARD